MRKLLIFTILLLFAIGNAFTKDTKNLSVQIANTFVQRHAKITNSYPWHTWCYSMGYKLMGLAKMFSTTGDSTYYNEIMNFANTYVDSLGNLSGFRGHSMDDMMAGSVLVWAYRQTGEERFKKATTTIRKSFDDYPRTAEGLFWHNREKPGEVWVDGVFMGQMFLTNYGKYIGDSEWCFNEAAHQLIGIFHKLEKDNSGLLYHAWDENRDAEWANKETGLSSEVWSEGLGWYALILVETLDIFPENHPKRKELEQICQKLLASLKRVQDPKTGLWYQVVDKGDLKDNWNETSGSAMFLYAIKKATELGIIPQKPYQKVIENAYRGILTKAIINSGNGLIDIVNACDGVCVQTSYDVYVNYKQSINAKEAIIGVLWASWIFEKPTSFLSCKSKYPPVNINKISIEAPFDMPIIKVPDFSKCEQMSITAFGAKQGDKEKTTNAIKKAIDCANKIGGGVVIIPEGLWITGKIHLKSNVNLQLNKGAVLVFSENPADYLPAVYTTWEGMECYNYSPLIYAFKCKNIAITGEGEIKAKMDVWNNWFSRSPAHMNSLKHLYNMAYKNTPVEERQMVNDTSHLRPQFIQFNRCENILLEGITISNSPFWVIHPYLSKCIVVRNVKVWAHGHNNDGVDPEMCQNMLIENCVFDQGDDAIAVKSGRDQDAWRLNTPTKNLVIKNCIVKNGHQLLAIGSELSGGIKNVYMHNCHVVEGAKLNHLVFIKTNERRGGFVKNIHVKNINAGKINEGILGIETDVLYQWRDLMPTYEKRLTPIKYIYLENIESTNVKFISRVLGQKELPVENVFFKNVLADTIRNEKHIHENIYNFMDEK